MALPPGWTQHAHQTARGDRPLEPGADSQGPQRARGVEDVQKSLARLSQTDLEVLKSLNSFPEGASGPEVADEASIPYETVNPCLKHLKDVGLVTYSNRTWRVNDLGKQTAHRLIYEISMEAIEDGKPFLVLLMNHPEISSRFSRDEIERVINPGNHVGLSQEIVQRTIKVVTNGLRQLPASIDITSVRKCPLRGKCGAGVTS